MAGSTKRPRDPNLLTVDEVAPRIRASIYTVRRLIKEGRLDAVKVRGVWRVTPAAVERLLAPSNGAKPKPTKRTSSKPTKRTGRK